MEADGHFPQQTCAALRNGVFKLRDSQFRPAPHAATSQSETSILVGDCDLMGTKTLRGRSAPLKAPLAGFAVFVFGVVFGLSGRTRGRDWGGTGGGMTL